MGDVVLERFWGGAISRFGRFAFGSLLHTLRGVPFLFLLLQFLFPPFPLRWSQNCDLSEEVGISMYFELFFMFSSLLLCLAGADRFGVGRQRRRKFGPIYTLRTPTVAFLG